VLLVGAVVESDEDIVDAEQLAAEVVDEDHGDGGNGASRPQTSKEDACWHSLDGKHVLNQLALADSFKAQGSNTQEREVDPSNEDKVVVHELQIEDTQENSNVITISDDTGGR
jgi:hypothetical protein